jgi:diguanylate cyclase (GGDEF)-like protein
MLATLVATLALVGTGQYLLVADRVLDELIHEHARIHEADGRSLERAAAGAEGSERPLDEVTEVLRAIEARPLIEDAVVADARGEVVASADPRALGTRDDEPEILESARTGRSFAGVPSYRGAGAEDGTRYSYVTPIAIGGERMVFEIEQSRAAASSTIGDLRVHLVAFLALTLGLAVVVFYLVGGRRIDRLYRAALHRARRDGLTDLDNHREFKDGLAREAELSSRLRQPLSVAVVDIDGFKFVNDHHGHRHGDRVLIQLAAVLRAGRACDRAFRLGGDEFAVLLPGTDETGARVALERVREAAAVRLGDATVSIGFASGVASGSEPESLWERADAALYEAKRRGGDAVVAAGELDSSAAPVVTIDKARALRRLLAEGHVEAALQPIWDLERGEIMSAEALARPVGLRDLDGPGEAFEVADRLGRAHELDALCRAAALRRAPDLPDGAVLFLNVAPQTLERGALADDTLLREVRAAGLGPERVVLEVTERSEARLPAVMAEAARLRGLGFGLALDDVGSGNAGLEMLRELAVDYVKIDRSVVQAAPSDRGARAVLLAIVTFAREVGASVIAEGIETQDLLAFVAADARMDEDAEARVRGAQGYLLGRPGAAIDAAAGHAALAALQAPAAGAPAARA